MAVKLVAGPQQLVPSIVVPAEAGIQGNKHCAWCSWTPAFAGVTT